MRTLRFAEHALTEGKKLPTSFDALVKQTKQRNDELQALLELVKEKTRELEVYEGEVVRKLEESGETAKMVGKILVRLETRKGRVSYSYKEAEKIYFDALMRLDQAAAKAAADAVEAIKVQNPDKVKLRLESLDEGLLDKASAALKRLVSWFKRWWSGFKRSLTDYDSAAKELAKLL